MDVQPLRQQIGRRLVIGLVGHREDAARRAGHCFVAFDEDAPARPPKAMEMVRILCDGHEAVARTARSVFPIAEKADDQPTADLLTQRLDIHEKTAWMLRSLLEE